MRVQIVEPQKTIECGICKSNGEWLNRINIHGISGLYCQKCDTLTIFDPLPSNNIKLAFQKEVEGLKKHYISQ